MNVQLLFKVLDSEEPDIVEGGAGKLTFSNGLARLEFTDGPNFGERISTTLPIALRAVGVGDVKRVTVSLIDGSRRTLTLEIHGKPCEEKDNG